MTVKKKEYEPVPPSAPPLPHEAEQDENMPMAVALDMETTNDANMPTSNPNDPGLATPTPHGAEASGRSDENARMERATARDLDNELKEG